MPAAPEAPPAAPAASPPSSPATVPAGAVKVSDLPSAPKEPAKPGSPRERLHQGLRDVAAKKAAPPVARQAPQPLPETPKIAQMDAPAPAKPPENVPAGQSEAPTEPKSTEAPKAQEGAPQAQAEAKKAQEKNPWKEKEVWKGKAIQLEQELERVKTSIVPEVERKNLTEKMDKIEQENKRLRDEIRYVNYEKSPEFQEKYHEPYKRSIETALSEFDGLKVTDASGNTRPINAEDVMAVASASSLPQAKELAEALFGEFAPQAMNYRTEIKKLFSQRNAALEEWKKKGETHLQEMTQKQQQEYAKLSEHIGNTWKSANEGLLKHEKFGKYFNPVEGDQEGNHKLAKGFELADRAFNEDPREPNLTADQRADRVKRHAAVRNRCAAFGRLVYLNNQLETKVAELEKRLRFFGESEPETSGSTQTNGIQTPQRVTLESMKQGLRKFAK